MGCSCSAEVSDNHFDAVGDLSSNTIPSTQLDRRPTTSGVKTPQSGTSSTKEPLPQPLRAVEVSVSPDPESDNELEVDIEGMFTRHRRRVAERRAQEAGTTSSSFSDNLNSCSMSFTAAARRSTTDGRPLPRPTPVTRQAEVFAVATFDNVFSASAATEAAVPASMIVMCPNSAMSPMP